MFLDWQDVEASHVLLVLKEIYKLFLHSDNWVDWPIAVDSNSLEVDPQSSKASKWSLMGASEKFAAMYHDKPLCDFVAVATREYLNELSDEKLIKGNFSYEDELALIELAIEELEKNG